MNKISSNRAFTLIELLVVLSIIGMLASVVLVAVSGVYSKAALSNSTTFETNMYHAMGTSLIGEWNFEEGSGVVLNVGSTVLADTSGNNNGATYTTAAISWSSNTFNSSASKWSLYFGAAGQMALANPLGISNSNFTIGHWIKISSAGSNGYTVLNAVANDGFRFGTSLIGNSSKIVFQIGSGGSATSGTCGTLGISDTNWHYIAGVFNRTGLQFSCYIDGKLSGTYTLASNYPNMPDSGVVFGKLGAVGVSPYAYIDQIRIYNTNLDGISIENIYNHDKAKYLARNN